MTSLPIGRIILQLSSTNKTTLETFKKGGLNSETQNTWIIAIWDQK